MPGASPPPRSHHLAASDDPDDLAPRSTPRRALALAGLLFAACLLLTAFLAQPAALAWTDGPGDVEVADGTSPDQSSAHEQAATPGSEVASASGQEPAPSPEPHTADGSGPGASTPEREARTALAELATGEPPPTPTAPQPDPDDGKAPGAPSLMIPPIPPVEPRKPGSEVGGDEEPGPEPTPDAMPGAVAPPSPATSAGDQPAADDWLESLAVTGAWLRATGDSLWTAAGQAMTQASTQTWAAYESGTQLMSGLVDWGSSAAGAPAPAGPVGHEPASLPPVAVAAMPRPHFPNEVGALPPPQAAGSPEPELEPVPEASKAPPVAELPAVTPPVDDADDPAELRPTPGPSSPAPAPTPAGTPSAPPEVNPYEWLAPRKSVIPILFSPSDWPVTNPEVIDEAEAIARAMPIIQRFYAENLDGWTFELAELQVVQGYGTAADYGITWDPATNPNQPISLRRIAFTTRVAAELHERGYPVPVNGVGEDYRVVVFVRGTGALAWGTFAPFGDGGIGWLGQTTINNLHGGISGGSPEDRAENRMAALGVTVHELGHTFWLFHPHLLGLPDGGSVMGDNLMYPKVGLSELDRSILMDWDRDYFRVRYDPAALPCTGPNRNGRASCAPNSP